MKRSQLSILLVFMFFGNNLFAQSGPPAPRVVKVTVNIVNACDWQVPVRFEIFEDLMALGMAMQGDFRGVTTKNGWVILEPSGSLAYQITNYREDVRCALFVRNTTTERITSELLMFYPQTPVRDVVRTWRIEWDNDSETYYIRKEGDD